MNAIISTIRSVAQIEKWNENDITLHLCDYAEAAEARAAQLKSERDAFVAELAAVKAERDALLTELQQKRFELQSANLNIKGMAEHNTKQHDKINALAAELADAKAERDALQSDIDMLRNELDKHEPIEWP